MPSILFKDTLYEIRKSKGRFLSIMLIVALGVAFFAGIKASAPDMKNSADAHFDKFNTQDLQVYSTIGFTQSDIDAIQKLKGVEEAQGLKTMDALMTLGSNEEVVKLISWVEDQPVNVPRLVKGRMPSKPYECVLEASTATNTMFGSLDIGDTIDLYSGTDTPLDEELKETSFKIVGMAYNPNYLSYEKGTSAIGAGSVDTFIYVMEDVFDSEYYTEADVTVVGAREINTYSDAYFEQVEPVVQAIEEMAPEQMENRVAEMRKQLEEKRKEADEQLAEAQKQLDDAKKQLDAGKAQLDAGQQKIDDSRKEIEDGQSQIDDGKKQLEDAKEQITSGQAQVDSGQKELDDAKAQLDSGWQQYNAGKAQIDQAAAQVDAQLMQIEQDVASLPQLEQQKKELERSQDQIKQLQKGIERLNRLVALRDSTQRRYEDLASRNPDSILLSTLKNTLDLQSAEVANAASELSGGLTTDAPAAIEMAQETIAQLNAADLQSQIDEIDRKLADIQSSALKLVELGAAKVQLEAAKKQLEESRATLDDSQAKYDAGAAELEDAKEQLKDAQAQYDAGQAEIKTNEAKIEDGLAQIEEGQAELDTNKVTYEDSLKEYEEGVKEFEKQKNEAQKQLADAERQIRKLSGEWIVLDRDSHYSYRDYESCAERMDGISSVFPVFFFLVAALVCMTTMTRMVAEERTDIGTLKALGYSKLQIAFKYLFYAGSASILGCVIGCLIGMILFPWIIFFAWNVMYNLEAIHFNFPISLILQASLSVTGVVLAATIFSIFRELMEVPSQLMRPKAAKAGRKILLERIPWIWNKVSFMHKVTIRNLFRDKKRFFMTVIGIAGCSALLVAGFGLNDSISDIVPRQFEDIYHFNATATATGDEDEIAAMQEQLEKLDGVDEIFAEKIMPVTLQFDKKDITGYVNVIEDPKDFKRFMTFIPMEGSAKDMKLDDSGVLISVKTAQKMNLKVGDEIEFETAEKDTVTAPVAGIFDQYIENQIYVTQDVFDTWDIGDEPSTSFLFINDSTEDDYEAALGSDVMAIDGIKSITFYSNLQQNFLDMIASIKLVVLVLVLSAAMLAFVVLYNLSNVNISERMREIATIKVLGFTEKEVNAYINRETLILSAIGAFAGLFMGIYLHNMIMNLAELDTVRFGRTINLISFGISFGLTLVFTFAINYMMKFKLRKIEMVESLKAVE